MPSLIEKTMTTSMEKVHIGAYWKWNAIWEVLNKANKK